MDVCRFILFVDENGWGAVYDKITDCVAEPFINRTLMCYQYGSGDADQAFKDACNWRMIGADLVGLTELCYGVDYLQGKDSIDINTGSVFRGEEQYVKGLQGLSKFCGAVAAGSKAVMACGKAAAATGAASTIDDAEEIARKGIYEFPDSAGSGKPYVGQSGNIPQRLKQHRASGHLGEGVPAKTSPVDGGKLAREIAEHRRIQKITGGVPAAKSPRVSNKRNPIGPRRGHLLDK